MTDTDLLLTFYGDDFTGSTDALESLALNGVDTILFLEPPGPDERALLEDVEAIGVAGQSRTMTPDEMDSELRETFEALAAFDAELFHYKVCSTFDSSPDIGSIGRAIDIGQAVFSSPTVPVVVAAPSLQPRGRYVLFGNLFATVDGTTYRIDRHPTMSEHPVTPMTEGDLTEHLAKQTEQSIGLVDIRAVDSMSGADLADAFTEVAETNDIVFFDGLNHEHQRSVGRAIWTYATSTAQPIFSASSSGLGYALTGHWREAGVVAEPEPPSPRETVDRVVVMSGSASPDTSQQIAWALEHGFEGVRLDTAALIDPDTREAAQTDAVETGLDILENGDSLLFYAARGPGDPAIPATKQRAENLGISDATLRSRLGKQQGIIMRRILEETGIMRACVAGGDTSGHVANQLDISALEYLAPVGPGSPLCRARSMNRAFDGLEIALKGGQVQTTDADANYFEIVRQGGTTHD